MKRNGKLKGKQQVTALSLYMEYKSLIPVHFDIVSWYNIHWRKIHARLH